MAQAPSHYEVEIPEVFEQPRPRRKKKSPFGKILAILAFGAIGFGVTPAGRNFFDELIRDAKIGWTVKRNPNYLFNKVGDKHVNILLIGEDRDWKIAQVYNPRTGKFAPMNVVDKDAPPRSDTTILMSLDQTGKTMRLLSLPRDARVRYLDPDGDRHRVKLNAVYASGGRDPKNRRAALKKFLADEMGIRVDRIAVINIDGFTNLIDQVNGIQVEVDGALKRDSKTGKFYRGHIHRVDHWGQWSVDLDPGLQTLNGKQAQGYVRFRYDIEGDPGRIRRQQQVMRALAKRIKEQPLYKLPGLAKELRKQFNADMDDTELASAAYFARDLGSSVKIQPLTPYGIYAKNGDIILNKPDNKKLFGAIFGSSFNPDKFLVHSASTQRDSIGHTNNRNPSALALLHKAGLIKDGDNAPESNAVLDAPVRRSDTGARN